MEIIDKIKKKKQIFIVNEKLNLAKITDIDLQDNIIKKCDKAFVDPVSLRENYKELLEKFNRYSEFVVAYDIDVLGYIIYYANSQDKKIAYVTLLAVAPIYQGKGIGKILFDFCIQDSKNKGFKKLRLEVKKNNIKAINLYESRGFKKITDNIKSIYMEKEL